jgi:hypothetical protein
MSNFLSKFTDLLFLISNYDKKYDYNDHIVIIGDYQENFISDFLEEIVEYDKIDRTT